MDISAPGLVFLCSSGVSNSLSERPASCSRQLWWLSFHILCLTSGLRLFFNTERPPMRDSTNPQPPRPDKNKEITVAQFSSARSKLHSELVPDILLSAGSVSSAALLFIGQSCTHFCFVVQKKIINPMEKTRTVDAQSRQPSHWFWQQACEANPTV